MANSPKHRTELKGYGTLRKSKAHGLVGALILPGTLITTGVISSSTFAEEQAGEVTTTSQSKETTVSTDTATSGTTENSQTQSTDTQTTNTSSTE